ncbi:hypothetical protein MSAN_00870600 [Mycena sanguinolenta]|uniref:Uncharacterized protein n=1 Tax=Mycena sanguinolenta TaxID=230812 RepID=A0A8H6YZW4_9AGAR|nr:hypothetical protein MSAN_00870600 [Mycena sanguinolenta]
MVSSPSSIFPHTMTTTFSSPGSNSLFLFPDRNPPDGYLFVCSPTDLQTGPTSFRWPDCPAYWYLDPSGSKPLTLEEASNLGFPQLELTTEACVLSWDDMVYIGIRKFHEGKGIDSDG